MSEPPERVKPFSGRFSYLMHAAVQVAGRSSDMKVEASGLGSWPWILEAHPEPNLRT